MSNNKKVAFKFMYRLRKEEEYNKIEKEYIARGYDILTIEYRRESFCSEILGLEIDKVKSNFKNVRKIAVISNVKDVIFLWAKAYSEIVNEFYYFIDKYNYSLIKNIEKYENIIKYGKSKKNTYTNLTYFNSEHIVEDVLKYRIDNMMVVKEEKETLELKGLKKISKKYTTEIGDISFISNEFQKYEEENIIQNNFENSDEIRIVYLKYFLDGVYKKYGLKGIREICISIFKNMKEKKEEEKKDIVNQIVIFFQKKSVDFFEKIAIYSLFIPMEVYYHIPSEVITEEMLKDEDNMKYYYSIMATVSMSVVKNNLILSKNFFTNEQKILEKMETYYDKNSLINLKIENKTIFFIVDELMVVPHSGTQLIFDLIINFKKKYSDYKIIVYSEDNFFGIQEEDIMGYSLVKEKVYGYSSVYSSVHKSYAEKIENIYFYYSDITQPKEKRVADLLEKINQYQPEVVISTSVSSYSTNIIYKKFPVIYLSLGSPNPTNKFDIQLLPHKENSINYLKLFNGKFDFENYYDFEYGTEFRESRDIYKKEEFGINKDDFILVTVGFRLKQELTEEFVKMITKLIIKYNNIKWYIIGETDIPAVDREYSNLVGKNIIKIKYEKNIGAFYKLCDLYVNPMREGGGFSISEAIINGVGVISHKWSAAGLHYGGEDNCVNDDKQYYEEIENRYLEKDYMLQKYRKALEKNSKYSYEKNVDIFYSYLQKAKESFKKRCEKNGEDSNCFTV
jgi:hypothetical protein